jgi:RNA polymerase sigma-70 factor (ECF subfamily)
MMNNNHQIIADYYDQHLADLRHYVAVMLHGDMMSAEDIVQDVFVALLCLQQPIIETSLKALVHKMLRQRVVDHSRRLATALYFEQQQKRQQQVADDVSSVVSAWELVQRLEQRMARMDTTSRDIIRLHIMDGCKIGEISNLLQMNYKSVEYKLGTARKVIRHYVKALKYA